jgi:hypothetical protein
MSGTALGTGTAPRVLGLGLGFQSIWVIGAIAHVDRHHWWSIIPAAP